MNGCVKMFYDYHFYCFNHNVERFNVSQLFCFLSVYSFWGYIIGT